MKSRKLVLALFTVLLLGMAAFSSTFAASSFSIVYDTSQNPLQWVPSNPATVTGPGVKGIDLTRGPGVEPNDLTRGFSAKGWDGAATRNEAIQAGKYFQFGLITEAAVSLQTLDFALRRSAVAAPMNFEVQVSLDGFVTPGIVVATLNYYGRTSGTAPAIDPLEKDPYYYMHSDLAGRPNTTSSPGDPVPTIDLTKIAALQNIPAGTQVTFRLYAWGTGASAPSNTVAFGRMTGPVIKGVTH
ncbi:MAG: hypothetical protein ACOX44_12250 [Limnochordia bacterium]|jgi:hypothetical protein